MNIMKRTSLLFLFLLLNYLLMSQVHIIDYADTNYMELVSIYDIDNQLAHSGVNFPLYWKLKDSLPDGIWVVMRENPYLKKKANKKKEPLKEYFMVSYYAGNKKNGQTIYYNFDSLGRVYLSCIANFKNNVLHGKYEEWRPLVTGSTLFPLDTLQGKYIEYEYIDGERQVGYLFNGIIFYKIYFENDYPKRWELMNYNQEILKTGVGWPPFNYYPTFTN